MTGGMAELTEVDVEAMVRDARAGDSAALGQLYDTYRDRVARFATGRLGDAEKAEDVTSETFEAVLPQPRLLPGRHRLRGVAVHHRPPPGRRPLPAPVPPARGRAGRGRAPGPPGRAAPSRTLPAVDGPEEAVLAAEQRAEVAGAFRRLRADQQEVLALRVLGGLSAAQVGEVLGKSEGAVRVAQHRALRSLREAMGVTAG